MKEFINEFGKDNFMIIFGVIIVVVLALVVIILIERHQSKKRIKNEINREINNCNRMIVDSSFEDDSSSGYVEDDLYAERDVSDDIVYVKSEPTREEAKEKLEEVTRKLVSSDSDLIEHTYFETEQEEKSIISYDELVRASHDIDQKNDKLLEDEGDAAISLEELYQKHVEEQNQIEIDSLKGKVSNPSFESDDKKFKNSEVISPVFGFYSGKVKQEVNEDEFLETLDTRDNDRDIEREIEKTEEFLTELKRLKNKLD